MQKRFDFLTLGNTPTGEQCAQISATEYDFKRESKVEGIAFIRQIARQFGLVENINGNAQNTDGTLIVRAKHFGHDFGTYQEICVFYDTDRKDVIDLAFRIEDETPEFWDDEAKTELAKADYFFCSALSV
jgi:hypothetical protein